MLNRYCIDNLYRSYIDTVSIQYRYSIDTVSIQYRYSINIACKNRKTGWKNRATGVSGVGKTKHRRALGSILGGFGGILGRLWWVRGGSERVTGDRWRPTILFFISWGLKLWNFVKTLICFWNGWKLIKMNFSSNFFLKVGFSGFFRELNVRKFRIFFPETFYDKKFEFYDKKNRF